jgi:hypothetical protein
MLDAKIRVNALIAYFFLGWAFLLARGNPDFAHPYIRAHAKRATFIHAVFLLAVVLVSFVLDPYLRTNLGFLPLSLDFVARILTYAVGLATVALGAVSAYRGDAAGGSVESASPDFAALFERTYELPTDRDRLYAAAALVPVLGFFAHARHPSPATADGVRASGLFALVFALVGVGNSYAAAMIVGLLYSVVFAFAAMSVAGFGRVSFPRWIGSVPLPAELSDTLARFAAAIGAFFAVAAGRREAFDLAGARHAATLQAQAERTAYLASHPDRSFPFAPEILLVPGLSVVFAWLMARRRESAYRRAYGQGLLISALFGALWFAPFYVPAFVGSILVLGLCVLAAHIRTAPETELPVMGLIARAIGSVGSVFSQTRASVAEKSAKKEVKLKVGE